MPAHHVVCLSPFASLCLLHPLLRLACSAPTNSHMFSALLPVRLLPALAPLRCRAPDPRSAPSPDLYADRHSSEGKTTQSARREVWAPLSSSATNKSPPKYQGNVSQKTYNTREERACVCVYVSVRVPVRNCGVPNKSGNTGLVHTDKNRN